MKGVHEQGLYRLFFEAIHPIAGIVPMISNSAASLGVEVKKETTRSLDMWHKRLGHVSHLMIREMEQKNMVDGLHISGRDANFCKGCVYGKSHRKEFPWKVQWVRAE